MEGPQNNLGDILRRRTGSPGGHSCGRDSPVHKVRRCVIHLAGPWSLTVFCSPASLSLRTRAPAIRFPLRMVSSCTDFFQTILKTVTEASLAIRQKSAMSSVASSGADTSVSELRVGVAAITVIHSGEQLDSTKQIPCKRLSSEICPQSPHKRSLRSKKAKQGNETDKENMALCKAKNNSLSNPWLDIEDIVENRLASDLSTFAGEVGEKSGMTKVGSFSR